MRTPKKPRRRRKYPSKHAKFLAAHRHLYDELLEAQGGGCAICGRKPSPRRKLDLDHRHREPMKIRGLLDHRCNRQLPEWVTAEWLRAAADYLEAHE